MGSIKKIYSVFFIFILFSFSLFSNVHAEVSGPGWFMGTADPVSHAEAKAYYSASQPLLLTQNIGALAYTGSPASATDITPELAELARALQYDPKLIYDYVHNHIDYVPYFGSLKGATLTYLDGSGNDADQASLMIALLRESSAYNANIGTVQYVYGAMTIPGVQLANWLGVDTGWEVIAKVIPSGGIPISNLYVDGTADVDRVWIQANIAGLDYLFDPAFKAYTDTAGIDIGLATAYDQNTLLTAAQSGATVGSDYVQNLNEANIRTKIEEYSDNLINTIRTQHPNKDVKEIVGGRSIVQTNLTTYQSTLPFTTYNTVLWTDVPANMTTTVRIQHEGIDATLYSPEIGGKRLTVTYSGTVPQLRLDGTLLDEGNTTTTGTRYDLIMTIDHPYAANGGTYIDQSHTFNIKSGDYYAVVSDFGKTGDKLMMKRQQELDQFIYDGLAETTEEVRGETLNIMGLTWMKEVNLTSELSASLVELVLIRHHIIGLMAQEAGYYIDVPMAYSSNTSRHNVPEDKWAQFKVSSLISSALEHAVLEQMMGSNNPGISTIRILQLDNAGGEKIFLADQSNFATIEPQLLNYDPGTISQLQYDVDNGRTIVLPQNGDLGLNQWSGTGYITKKFDINSGSIGMIISGGYNGGYVSIAALICSFCVDNSAYYSIWTTPNSNTSYFSNWTIDTNWGRDPVEMAGGNFVHDHTDLSLGGRAPLGLSFSRSYNSRMNLKKRTLGYGWTHNYDIYLQEHSHGGPVLGTRQPVDAAALITKLYITLDLLKTDATDELLKWTVSSLASKWAADRMIDNAVTVHLGSNLMEFVKLPDGSYSPPPGITTKLIDNGDNTFTLEERFGTTMDFDTTNRITQLTDIDGNTLTFTYNTDGLETVQDIFGRTLTLNYTSGKIVSVSDSAGRSVSYIYTSDDLTGYTDAEGKLWTFAYTDVNHPHRMTDLTNPLSITTATNVYDSLGRVKSQTSPKQTGSSTYNFYFSGFRNALEDPDGDQEIYYYDEKGRPIATEDQLGNKSYKEYDGQSHVVKTIDPRGNETGFTYDGNHNMIQATNALTHATNLKYDALFRLTDTIDPLLRGSHIIYDSEHHPTDSEVGVLYDGSFVPQDNGIFQTNATYYPNGQTETTTDDRLTVTTLTYDTYGNPLTSKVAAHPAVNYNYDTIGRMNSLTDQVSSATGFVYDGRGLLQNRTDPLGQITNYYYDDAGRLDHVIDRKGDTVSFTYIPSDKTDTITYPDLTTVSFTYNDHDDLTMMQDTMGNTSYTYYADHSLQTVTDPQGFQVAYTYDEAGNLTELTYPGSKKVIYTYDALNRLETVTIDWLNSKPVATYYYDNAGRLDYVDNFNGTVTDYTYDNASRLTDLVNKKADQTIISEYHFTLDGNGNRTQVNQSEPLLPVINEETSGYTYNTERNRLQTAGASSFAYDLEGQLSTKDVHSFTFDYNHRLKTVSGANNYQYSYDGSGKRLKAIRDSVETRYIYDAAGNLLAEANSSNVILRYYIHGAGLMAIVKDTNEVYTYHYDAVGNTIAMTDEAEVIVNSYAYTPFGILANENESVIQPFKFVGQFGVMTEPNGFYYMRARYYDTEVGRFIAEDPIGFDGGDVNLYAYTANNPLLFIDPEGLWTFQIGVSTTGGAGVGGTYGRGVVWGYSGENGWQFGTYETYGAGGYGGVGASATVDLTWSGNDNIHDLAGIAGTTGGSAGAIYTGGAEVNIMPNAKPSWTVSGGVSASPTIISAEGHGFVTNTTIKECCK